MKKILILCTGNSCRSQMAEGWMRHYAGEKALVMSAGIETHGLNPMAVATMKSAGIDISGHQSDLVDKYSDVVLDYILTVCDHAKETCPYIPSNAERLHQAFSDPSKLEGSQKEIDAAFKETCEEIRAYCESFVQKYLI